MTSFRRATAWSFVMTGGQQATMFIVTVVLAALLGPETYGTVAMATVYIMFIQMLLQQGLIPAIVQREDLRPDHLNAAFWTTLGGGAVLTVLSIALSGWWADVNRLPELQAVIVGLSALLPIRALVVVQQALLTRNMDFRSLAIRSNVAAAGSGIVGVGLALAGWGVWALVAQQVTRAFIELVTLWAASTWRPAKRFSLHAAKELWGFSASSSLSSLAVFVNNRSDALLIGVFFGPVAVGLYRFALRFVDLLVDVASRSLQAVSLPELSRLQHDEVLLGNRAVRIMHVTSLLTFPALGVLAASSNALMEVVGREWAPAASVLALLCIVGALRSVGGIVGSMLQAMGRPQQLARLAWLQAVLSAAAFVAAGFVLRGAGTSSQVTGIAGSRVLLYVSVFAAVQVPLLIRLCGVSPVQLTRTMGPAVVAAAVATFTGRGVVDAVLDPATLPAVVELVIVAVVSAVAALGALIAADALARDLGRLALRRMMKMRRSGHRIVNTNAQEMP